MVINLIVVYLLKSGSKWCHGAKRCFDIVDLQNFYWSLMMSRSILSKASSSSSLFPLHLGIHVYATNAGNIP